jgi:hypothetical protein
MLSAFQGAGPSTIDATLFRNCFASLMIRNHLPLRALNVLRRRKQNGNGRLSLREIQTPMKRKQFRGPRDWQNQFRQTMISQYSAACLVEHLVKSRKMTSRSDAVFI